MKRPEHNGGGVILTSFLVALLLTAIPLPDWAAPARPAWVTLVLIYWCMALPNRVGVGIGWLVGLVLDVLQGVLLGQHALALAFVAFATLRWHRQIRLFPLWQQALVVGALVILSGLIQFWIYGITDRAPMTWKYWLPTATSMVFWPWVFVLLRRSRRRFQVF